MSHTMPAQQSEELGEEETRIAVRGSPQSWPLISDQGTADLCQVRGSEQGWGAEGDGRGLLTRGEPEPAMVGSSLWPAWDTGACSSYEAGEQATGIAMG